MIASLLLLLSFILSGCFLSTSNPLNKEDYILFESVDKHVRLEIATKTSDHGRLYVMKDEVLYTYTVMYCLINHWLGVYLSTPGKEQTFFSLDVSFESVGFFKTNYDQIYLKDESPDLNHPVLSGFDMTLNRNREEQISALNYFHNTWFSADIDFTLINNDLASYYHHSIHSSLNNDVVVMEFSSTLFCVCDEDKQTIILAGNYFIDGLNLILEPLDKYSDYPKQMTLIHEFIE